VVPKEWTFSTGLDLEVALRLLDNLCTPGEYCNTLVVCKYKHKNYSHASVSTLN
jgi:hypothetical protein